MARNGAATVKKTSRKTAHPLKRHPAAIAALSNRAAKIKHNNNRGGKSGNCFDNTLAASMVN